MGHFHSGEHTINYSGQEMTKANGVSIICNRKMASAVLGYNPINDRIITMRMQGKPNNVTVI